MSQGRPAFSEEQRASGSDRRRWLRAAERFASGIGVILVLLALFIWLGDVAAEDGRVELDRDVAQAIHPLDSHALTVAMRFITDIGAAPVVIPVFLLMAGWLLWHHQRRTAVIFTVSWLGAQLLDFLLKLLYHRSRPEFFPHLTKAVGYSFPSGHTTTALVTYGLLAYLIARSLHGWRRALPIVGAVFLVVVVAFSRVYLGVHYFSDTVGSVLMGSAWLRASLLALKALVGHQ